MSSLYLESSAVLSWINGEPAGDHVRSLMDKAEFLVTSILTPLEVRRGLIRRETLGEITTAARSHLLGLLEQRLLSWELLDLTPEILVRASQSFPGEPVRSLDAIHLATIIEAIKVYPDFQVLSLDNRILQNLEPLGLTQVLTTTSLSDRESR